MPIRLQVSSLAYASGYNRPFFNGLLSAGTGSVIITSRNTCITEEKR